jgi:hypothetical protein
MSAIDIMDDFDGTYAALRDAVLEMPTGDPEDPVVRDAVSHIQSLLASEYLVEVEPGKYKFTSEGIAHLMAKAEPCDGPPPDAVSLNAKLPPRKH